MSSIAKPENATVNTLRAELARLDSQIRQVRQIVNNMESTAHNIRKIIKSIIDPPTP
jgi:prefoldin subunit 5